jgi:hypothetical protein
MPSHTPLKEGFAMNSLKKTKILLILASFLCASLTPTLADHHESDMHDGPPPMLVLMPPSDIEEPEGVEISENPEEAFGQIANIFFDMMDVDGNGELNRDELMAWLSPPPMDGEGMHGEGMDGEDMDMEEMRRRIEEEIRHEIHMQMREEHLSHMRHEIEEMREHEQHMRDEVEEMQRHREEMQQELARIRDDIVKMEEELKNMEEEEP